LGSVSVDVYRKEREFKNLTLSDENVVKYLILHRSKVDTSYGASVNMNIYQSGDTFEFNQELIVLYSSLDRVIDKCNFRKKNTKLLELIYEGNTIHDIVAMNIGYKRSATYDLFDRMVKRIVDMNNKDWKTVMMKRGFIKNEV